MSALALLALALCAGGTVDRAEGSQLVVYARGGVRVVALASVLRPLPSPPWEGLTLRTSAGGCRLTPPARALEREVRTRLTALRQPRGPRTGP